MRPLLFILAAAATLSTPAWAQPDPSGIDFVTIGSPDNPAWAGNGTPGDRAVGRGSVPYEYRIGRYEVTTAQWVEFFNAAYDRPSSEWMPHISIPFRWGAVSATPTTPGGRRWIVPAGSEMIAVGNVSWRTAAMYCNWLHNDKSTDLSAFMNGAYDVSTFGYTGNIFTDQAAHHPNARYWIPTWDEWLKAAHFDPHRHGTNQPGWWTYSTNSDTEPIGGPPGIGQANTGFSSPNPFGIPLGAYNVTSPWGLYDVAGATTEWTEEVFTLPEGLRFRVLDGSWWWDGGPGNDRIGSISAAEFPNIATFDFGFRIASAVPAPGTLLVVLAPGILALTRRNRLMRAHSR
jgi:sulfatase modifying factor 1